MSTNDLRLIRHRLKGTLQQVDMTFRLLEDLLQTDLAEAESLRETLVESLEKSARELRELNLQERG